jgi:hypothetical protein
MTKTPRTAAEIDAAYERELETRDLRRHRADERAYDRLDRLERQAEPLIGELQGEAGFRYYINLKDRHGRPTGKIKESRSRADLIAYLVRNHYV